ncbi:MAG: hypothetical protein JSS32_05180 [Verrucomicrobia bacterium]|nr:hypothetical protein [Verrucomicrobiota bacterium]
MTTIQATGVNASSLNVSQDVLTQLYTALKSRDFATAKQIIESNPSLNGPDVRITVPNMGTYGILPLVIHYSYLYGQNSAGSDLALEMINQLGFPLTDTPASEGNFEVNTDSAFYEAISAANKNYGGGNYSILEAILDKRPDFINRVQMDPFQQFVKANPLFSAGVMGGDLNLVNFLLSKMTPAEQKAQVLQSIPGVGTVLDRANAYAGLDSDRAAIAKEFNSIANS